MGATDVSSEPQIVVRPGRGGRPDSQVAKARRQAPWAAAAGDRWLPGLVAGIALTVTVWGLMVQLTAALRGDELTSLVGYSARGPSAIWGTTSATITSFSSF